jgi:hypothetical protein
MTYKKEDDFVTCYSVTPTKIVAFKRSTRQAQDLGVLKE